MTCPDCGGQLTRVFEDAHRCYGCGGFWLSSWAANRINSRSLDKYPQTQGMSQSIATDLCPTDGSRLATYKGESVPPNLGVRTCKKCNWWWFGGNSLFDFKPAQEAKITYFKSWGIAADVSAFLLPVVSSATLLVGLSIGLNLVRTRTSIFSQAASVISGVTMINLGGGQALIGFTSSVPVETIKYRLQGDSDWQEAKVQVKGNSYSAIVDQVELGRDYEIAILGKVFEVTP